MRTLGRLFTFLSIALGAAYFRNRQKPAPLIAHGWDEDTPGSHESFLDWQEREAGKDDP